MIETKYEKSGDVVVVTMANPPANTFTMELSAGLEGAIRRAVSEEARALVLQADGPLFCGGADVHLFAGTTAGQAREMFAEGFQLINTLEDAPFPVIAAVHGMCFAAGLELTLACDLIIAAEGAQFAQVEAKIGAATFLGGVYRLAERCRPGQRRSSSARRRTTRRPSSGGTSSTGWFPTGICARRPWPGASSCPRARPWRTR